MSGVHPELYLAHVKIADRRGRILIDWLRNGLGATTVASFCPGGGPGAGGEGNNRNCNGNEGLRP